ncbi:unnamed protein product, partial [Hapterophycus canaliculatus]
YAGDLETALRSLALHILLSLVLGGASAASQPGTNAAVAAGGDSGRAAGGGDGSVSTTAALLAEYADDVLEVLSSPESDTALSCAELSPFYGKLHGGRGQMERHEASSQEGAQRKGIEEDGRNKKEGLREGTAGAGVGACTPACLSAGQQRPLASPSQLLQAGLVLAAAAERLVHLLDRGDDCGGGDSGDGAQSLLVSKQTLTACVSEVARRRLRVDRLLGGDNRSGSSTEGFPWD